MTGVDGKPVSVPVSVTDRGCIVRPTSFAFASSRSVWEVGKAPGIAEGFKAGIADGFKEISSILLSAAWNMLTLLAAADFFDRSERSSCFAGSLRLSVIQLGSGRLNIADLSELASEVFLLLVRLG